MSLPKFGMLTNPLLNTLKEIDAIAKFGFDFVEIGLEEPGGDPGVLLDEKKKILKLIEEKKLFIIAHTPWWIELGTEYENVRKEWVELSKERIDVANQLKIKTINFHSHSRGLVYKNDKYRKRILDNYVESLRELVSYAKQRNMQIIFENAASKGEIVEVKYLKYIIDRVPGLKFHLDVGHAFINGGMKSVKDFIMTFRDKLEHIHMHDNHGIFDEHAPIGKGKIDYASVVRMLKGIGYDKTITFEVFTSKEDAVKSREKIKKLWNEK